jgi:hypothetical protein
MAAWHALSEEPNSATLCVAGAATIKRAAAATTMRETGFMDFHLRVNYGTLARRICSHQFGADGDGANAVATRDQAGLKTGFCAIDH